ncbi:hypothetical protein [Lentzea sp.]|uniref:hypothetical protein n=1 Tax=Lentzea sp. TaxID=56099 RepID=UPI002C976494|nr:hypothetical protein [Lentzea sp.]HUQ54327.1 hypothetical protein [Lentzea sp.]
MPRSEFGPDGTQDPPPPRLFPDPLAGLVTADTWIAPQWTSASSTSRVSVPTPPVPTDDVRQAIWSQMQREQRRPRAQQRQVVRQPWAPATQIPVAQQQQPAKPASGVAAFLGCLVVIAFFVLVLLGVLGAIFGG